MHPAQRQAGARRQGARILRRAHGRLHLAERPKPAGRGGGASGRFSGLDQRGCGLEQGEGCETGKGRQRGSGSAGRGERDRGDEGERAGKAQHRGIGQR